MLQDAKSCFTYSLIDLPWFFLILERQKDAKVGFKSMGQGELALLKATNA